MGTIHVDGEAAGHGHCDDSETTNLAAKLLARMAAVAEKHNGEGQSVRMSGQSRNPDSAETYKLCIVAKVGPGAELLETWNMLLGTVEDLPNRVLADFLLETVNRAQAVVEADKAKKAAAVEKAKEN